MDKRVHGTYIIIGSLGYCKSGPGHCKTAASNFTFVLVSCFAFFKKVEN